MATIGELQSKVVAFRDARNWKQFHSPKDAALSLLLEAAELAEHFQWKNESESRAHLLTQRKEVGDELADLLYWVLLMSHDFEIDLAEAFRQKMAMNEEKYPVDKAYGNSAKYSALKASPAGNAVSDLSGARCTTNLMNRDSTNRVRKEET